MNGKPPPHKLIEARSIDFVPEDERHGRVRDQGLFWFLGNFHFFAIAIGFVGPSLGLSVAWSILAGTLGMLIGTTFQAFHASQGPETGLPQMIQSRAQFGFRGVIIPLIGVLITMLGYNVVAAVLIAAGVKGIWGLDRTTVTMAVALVGMVLAVFGHDWLHRAFRIMFWISLPLFLALSLAIVIGHAGGATPAPTHFGWPAFLAQLAAATGFNLSVAPYVSDYSRYLPRTTRRLTLIANVFAGSALSGIWMIAIGAWLGAHVGTADCLVSLRAAGDAMLPGLGSVLVGVSICVLVATVGMTNYSSMMTFATMADCFRPVLPTRRLRVVVILGVTAAWAAVAICFGGDAISYVNGVLAIMLYFLIPWTAVNLIDYFFLRKGRYSIADFSTPHGVYGAWGVRGLAAYAAGFLASIPFFVVPGLYTGPFAAQIGGSDIGWLVSLVASSLTYVALNSRMPAPVPAVLSEDRP